MHTHSTVLQHHPATSNSRSSEYQVRSSFSFSEFFLVIILASVEATHTHPPNDSTAKTAWMLYFATNRYIATNRHFATKYRLANVKL